MQYRNFKQRICSSYWHVTDVYCLAISQSYRSIRVIPSTWIDLNTSQFQILLMPGKFTSLFHQVRLQHTTCLSEHFKPKLFCRMQFFGRRWATIVVAETGPCIPCKRRECIPVVVEERRQEFLFLARAIYIRRAANLERNKKKSRRATRGKEGAAVDGR